MDKATVELVLANRSFMYALVARAFAEEPDEGFAGILCGEHAHKEAGLLDYPETPAIVTLVGDMAQRVSAPDGLAEAARDYVRIFVGPGTLRANPWETVQLTGTRALFQTGVLKIRDAYREAGFEPMRVREVPDDFIGIELDFMAKLAERAFAEQAAGDDAWRADLDRSKKFLQQHLLKWADKLADSVEAEYGDGFYTCACRLAELIAKRDLRMIEDLGVG